MAISRIDKFIFEVSGKETIKEAAARRQRPLQIICSAPFKEKHGQMIKMAVALGLRVFSGAIHLHLSSDYDSLIAELIDEGLEYDGLQRVARMPNSPQSDFSSIKIGNSEGPGFIADADGWVAYIQMPAPDQSTWASSVSSAFSVSCAFASLVKAQLLGKESSISPWKFNLLSLNEDPEFGKDSIHDQAIDIGYIGLLGAGAIGCAFAYLLKLSGWRANVDIIDSQRYEEPNHETSLLISKKDVLILPKKAEFLAAILNDSQQLQANPYVQRIDATSESLNISRDVFICGVDNVETRQCLDKVRSRLLINAGLGGSKFDAGHVLYTEHGFLDQKLSESYSSKSKSSTANQATTVPREFRDQCSRLNYESASLAAPFFALASAALLLSGCARHALHIQGEISYLKADLLGHQRSMQKKTRAGATSSIVEVTL